MRLNYESCAAAAALYKTKRDFRENKKREYNWLHNHKLMEKACSHMTPLRRSLSNLDISNIAKRYTHRRAFKLGDQGAYQQAIKRGILEDVCAHMDNERYRLLSDEQIGDIAKKFNSKLEFLDGDKNAYKTASKRGILDVVCSHMKNQRVFRRLSNDELLEIAQTFRTRNDFKLGDFGAYTTTIRRGLIEEACAHMEYGATGFREDKPATLYQFKLTLECGTELYKVGITNRQPRHRLKTFGLNTSVKARLSGKVEFDSGRDARIVEKQLHKAFESFRYDGPSIMTNGMTEVFTVPLFKARDLKDSHAKSYLYPS